MIIMRALQLLNLNTRELLRLLTLLPSLIDLILTHGRAHLVIASTFIKDLRWIRVRIVNANNAMAPALADEPIAPAQESLLILVVSHLLKLIPECLDFLAGLLRRTQRLWQDRWVWIAGIVVKERRADLFESLHVVIGRLEVFAALVLVDQRWASLFLQRGHSVSFLERRRSVLKINKVLQLALLTAQVHKWDTGLDRLAILGVLWGTMVSSSMLHHRCLCLESVLLIDRVWLIQGVSRHIISVLTRLQLLL